MKTKHVGRFMMQLKKSSPTILSIIGAAGVFFTAFLVAKETPKVEKKMSKLSNAEPAKRDKLKIYISCYAPAIIVGVTATACIVGSNVLNKRQQASMIGTYTLLRRSYSDYQSKVKELYGKEAHEQVLKAMSEENVNPNHTVYAQCLFDCTTLDFGVPEEEYLFYDSYGKRHFTSTIGKVLQAEYHLNRNFAIRGDASLNEFYGLLGIAPTKDGDEIGWWVNDDMEIYLIDFNHSVCELDDGLDRPPVKCLVIDYPFLPDLFANGYY